MKKINLSHYLTTFSLAFVLFANKASAAMVNLTNPIGSNDFNTIVSNFLQWLLSIAGSIAMFMLIWGGIMYIGASGDEQKAAKGKKIITWAILGLMLVLSSFAIVKIMEGIFVY